MCRLAALLVILTTVSCCNEYPVEHCVQGQGVLLPDDDVPRAGAEYAPIEVTVFSDFQCPGTWRLWYELVELLEQLEGSGRAGEISVRFRHFPLTEIHPRALNASLAAEAARLQGEDAFWAIFPRLLTDGSELTDEHLLYYAEAEGLDLEAFEEALVSQEVRSVVDRDLALASDLKLPGTPGVILCGVPVDGYPDSVMENINFLLDL